MTVGRVILILEPAARTRGGHKMNAAPKERPMARPVRLLSRVATVSLVGRPDLPGSWAAQSPAPPAAASEAPDLNLDYERFTLDNGLRVIVHEDRKAPVVAVSIWYHVGSKNEPEGKTGFAHLFEHL